MNDWFKSLKHRFDRDLGTTPDLNSPAQGRGSKSTAKFPTGSLAPEKAGSPPPDQRIKVPVGIVEVLLFGLGLLFFASLLLGLVAFTRSLWRAVPADIQYQHTGSFSYSAAALAGVYDAGALVSGEPIFPKLTCQVALTFKYTFLGDHIHGLTGTHPLTAQVIDETIGWQRTVPLEQETAFSGENFTGSVLLDVCQAEALADYMETETDIHPTLYSLVIRPHVQLSGTISGKVFQDTFNPALIFNFDKLHVYLFQDDPKVDPFNPTATGLIKNSRMAANILPLFGLKPEISQLRKATATGLGISLAGLLLLRIFLYLSTRRSQESYLQMKYGSLLVDVQCTPLEATLSVVDVISMDELAKLAERMNTLILHERNGVMNSYFVREDHLVCRYTIGEQGAQPQALPPLQDGKSEPSPKSPRRRRLAKEKTP